MTQRSWSLIAAACALLACLGCSDEERVPPAPGPTDSSNSGENKRDAGREEEDEDAGKPPLGESPISFCTRVTPPAGSSADNPIGTYLTMPSDLKLSRQVERWNDDCKKLRLILEFTDGACPAGLGHSLTFSFGYQDFVDGVIHGGNNAVAAGTETPAISVRYVRPKHLEKRGEWGTCEAAEGQLVFVEAPTPRAGNYLSARFQLTLTPCDETKNEPYFIDGAFNLLMRTSATDVCPTIDSGF